MFVHLPHSFEYYDFLLDEALYPELDIYSVEPSVDFINITVPFRKLYSDHVSLFLDKYFKNIKVITSYNNKPETYEVDVSIDNRLYKMYCRINYGCYRTSFQFKEIDKDLISYIVNIFKNIDYIISRVEYSLDFYTTDNGNFYSFLSSTAKLKFRSQKFTTASSYDTTRYLNNVRNTRTLGGRIYIKKTKQDYPVRMEATMGDKELRKNGLTTIEDAVTVSPRVPFNRYEFRRFDHKKFLNNSSVGASFEDDFFSAMKSSINCGGISEAMKVVAEYKNNPHYYLKHHWLFNEFFAELMSEHLFLDTYGDAIESR